MSVLSLTVDRGGGHWNVWMQLHAGNPTDQGESLVIGCGDSREEAIKDAIRDIAQHLDTLCLAPGTLHERKLVAP